MGWGVMYTTTGTRRRNSHTPLAARRNIWRRRRRLIILLLARGALQPGPALALLGCHRIPNPWPRLGDRVWANRFALAGGMAQYALSAEAQTGRMPASLSFHEAGFLLGASCGCGDGGEAAAAAAEAMGLLVEHAYSVLEVRAVAGPPPPPGAPRGYRGSGARLLKLRNPWGRLEWRGDWSDDSPLWTAELRAQLGFPEAGRRLPAGPKGGGDGDDGVFWMAWDDFRDYFTAVDVCRVRPEWAEVRFGLSKVGPLP